MKFNIGDKVCKNYQPGVVEDIVLIEGQEYLKIEGWVGWYKAIYFESHDIAITHLKSQIRSRENQIAIIENAFKI